MNRNKADYEQLKRVFRGAVYRLIGRNVALSTIAQSFDLPIEIIRELADEYIGELEKENARLAEQINRTKGKAINNDYIKRGIQEIESYLKGE